MKYRLALTSALFLRRGGAEIALANSTRFVAFARANVETSALSAAAAVVFPLLGERVGVRADVSSTY